MWISSEMCVQDCRTFLWGGAGVPMHDAAGRCSCLCEDDSWSDLNILGRASCVPVMTHRIFGWVGLVLSVAALSHAAYSLDRQVRYNAQGLAAWTSHVEHCRWHLHLASIAVALLSLFYFTLVLGDELPLSVYVLGVAQFPVNISFSFLATRMWIYAIDPQLMQQYPEMLKTSSWLQTPIGRYVVCGAISAAPGVGLALIIAGRNDLAIKVMSVGVVLQAVIVAGSFWKGGRSLVKAIDVSLQQHLLQQQMVMTMMSTLETTIIEQEDTTARVGTVEEDVMMQGGGEDESLLGAKRRVNRMVTFALELTAGESSVLLFSVCTTYGTAAPLPLFVAPMALLPLIWDIVNTQLHAGRSKVRDGGSSGRRLSVQTSLASRRNSTRKSSISRRASSIYSSLSGKVQVVPNEEPST
ncbi:unnamed protein product [Pylaiella littoralis]